jgi:hypothetical protein
MLLSCIRNMSKLNLSEKLEISGEYKFKAY